MALIASLEVLVMIVLFEQVEYFGSSSMVALPTMLRRKLLKYLPIADILLLESAHHVTDGLDMNQVWRELVQDRLGAIINASKDLQRNIQTFNGRWKDFYLNVLWNQVICQAKFNGDGLDDSNYLKNVFRASTVRRILVIDCYKTKLLDSLFGVSVRKVPATRSSASLRKLYCIYCPSCKEHKTIIPKRFLLHYTERKNRFHLLYYLCIFWTYGEYSPDQITTNLKMDAHGLANTILSKYPDTLSTPLHRVQTVSLKLVYNTPTQLHALSALSAGLGTRSLHSLTLDLRTDWEQAVIPDILHSLPSSTTKLIVLNKLQLQEDKNVLLERVISHYTGKLEELVLNMFPLSVNTSEELILAIRGLFSKRKFRILRLIDAELSFEVMNELVGNFLSSKYEQELELNSLRVYQYTDRPSLIRVGSQGRYTRQKHLTLTNMYTNEGFTEPGQYLFDILKTLPLKRLTITSDLAAILNTCQSVPVLDLVLQVKKFQGNCNKFLGGVVAKDGIDNVVMEVYLDEWVEQIHLQTTQQMGRSMMDDITVAMKMAANSGKLKRVEFSSKNQESKILGSANPLSLPEGTLLLIFNSIFSFSNLHCLTMDISRFNAMSTLIRIIIGAWSTVSNGKKIKKIVISKTKIGQETIEQLQKLCDTLVYLNHF